MKKILTVIFAALLVLPFSGAFAANDNAGPQGIHEPGTGIENPEVKADGQGTGQGLTNQEAIQAQNQGDDSQIQGQAQTQAQSNTQSGIQRRVRVEDSSAEMYQIANRNIGIGDQIRENVQNQNQNFNDAEANLARAQERSSFAKFFVGPNYGQIYSAEQKMEKIQERIQELNQLKAQVSNEADQQLLQNHIQNLEQVKTELQNQLQEEQKGFSLLGWVFRMFAR